MGARMNGRPLQMPDAVNVEIVRFRGLYSAWAKRWGISYNEMLVLYTIRDNGHCTQKQICDDYLLPRQTMNHVISEMRKRGLLTVSPENGSGREKAFVLTEEGQDYAAPILEDLDRIEKSAIHAVGRDGMETLSELMGAYNDALRQAMEDSCAGGVGGK